MIKTLEGLQSKVLEFKQDSRDHWIENLEESTEFTLGSFAGEDRAFHLVLDLLDQIINGRN